MKDTDPFLPELRRATARDALLLGGILGRAFSDDPVMNWAVRQDNRREQMIKEFFTKLAERVYLPRGECFVNESGTGASMWMGLPGHQSPSLFTQLGLLWFIGRRNGFRRLPRVIGS